MNEVSTIYEIGSYLVATDGRVSDREQFIVRGITFVDGMEVYKLEQFSNGAISYSSAKGLGPA